MNMADRIQSLRKSKGISQEELADRVGVSRQAVSKWESEQSTPDIDKIITMSEFFGVTTDYILKGIEPVSGKSETGNAVTSKILYIASTAFLVIGLLCAFASWYEEQMMYSIWGCMIIQAVGAAGYFIGTSISQEKAPFLINWLNVVIALFMPISMVSGILSMAIFHQGWIAPYPSGFWQIIVFILLYGVCSAASYHLLRRHGRAW